MAETLPENSRFRVAWDAGIVALILVSCTIIPFQLAFGLGPGGLGGVIIYAIDAVFIADIGLNLQTRYRFAGMVVTEPRRAITSRRSSRSTWLIRFRSTCLSGRFWASRTRLPV